MIIKPKYARQQFLGNIVPFKVNCVKLDFCTDFKYLGHWLLNDLNDVKDMKREMRALYARVNNLTSCFYDYFVNLKMSVMENVCYLLLWGGFTEIGRCVGKKRRPILLLMITV